MIAVFFLVLGHICKARRWKQLIGTYETVETVRLLEILAVGQGINMVVPFRVGDMVRVYLLGKKQLKNGYVLALASVIVDMFIDTITVGVAFGTLFLLNIHREEIAAVAFQYVKLSVILLCFSLVAVWKKKYVKLLIQRIAAFFNDNLERKILIATYTVFSSMKDAFYGRKILKLGAETVGVWTCYFMSYAAFAVFLQKMGFDFTLTGVFRTIFSMAGSSLLLEFLMAHRGMNWFVWFFIYLLLPLCIIFLVAEFKKRGEVGKTTEYHSYRKVLPQMNPADKLAFLNIYFAGENKNYINLYLTINEKVSILQDFSAGSNATTILCMDEKDTFYRKYAFGEDADKLWEQVEWLKQFKDRLPLAKILREYRKEEYCYYDMEYSKDTVGFFRFIHTSPPEDSWCVLEQVLKCLGDRLYSESRKADFDTICAYVDKKITVNRKICDDWGMKKFKKLYKSETVWINGTEYPNLSYYNRMLDEKHLITVFENDSYAAIHGDLTIENIVCRAGNTNDWYLIDPNTGNLHETPFLDYAKLLQSLHGGYEFLMMVKNVQVTDNRIEFLFTGSAAYQQLYEKYKEYLFSCFSFQQVRSIYYHEVVHWFRLMPYKIRKNPMLAVVFYAGLLMVLSDVEKMFREE